MCYEAISTGIVLTFVGILATFVVVSNYAQVKETGDRVTKLEGQVNKLSAEMTLNDAKLRGEIISAMSESPEEFQKYISRMLELRKKGKKDSPNQSKDNE
jgi:hypothetical protein